MATATQTTKSGSPTIMEDAPYRAAMARLGELKARRKETYAEERRLETEAHRLAHIEADLEAATALVIAGESLDTLHTRDGRADVEAELRGIPFRREAVTRALHHQQEVTRLALNAAIERVRPAARREHQAAVARIARAVHELVAACEAEAAVRARYLYYDPHGSGPSHLLPAMSFPNQYTSLAKLQHQALDWLTAVAQAGYDVPKPSEGMLDSTGRKFHVEMHKLRRQ